MNKYVIIAASLIALFASGDSHAGQKKESASPKVFNMDTAMLAIFGEYDEKHKGTLIPVKYTPSWNLSKAELLASPIMAATYTESGKKKGVIAIQRQQIVDGEPEISHGTAPAVSVYVFAYDGQKWEFEKGKKEVVNMGSHGRAPDGELIKIGDEKYGLLFNSGYSTQGYTEINALILSLSEPVISNIAKFDIGADNSGDCSDNPKERKEYGYKKCWSYSGKLEFIKSATDAFYIIRHTTEGTAQKEDQNKIIKVNSVKYYAKPSAASEYKTVSPKEYANITPIAPQKIYSVGETN